ncbi:hypothetical protein [Actinocrispum wychmicini]|uniref:Uncharacterized protein n=1 Tax=Actinocrispum wychmicini TaxID=1213861 RepID=A0A4R2JBS0_9PSEU|nr:hypothetical protein [Actinocrispum wychmicini]TCO53529.1 hypothetical protein EV192_110118 [Actinocrispum wychmicini]
MTYPPQDPGPYGNNPYGQQPPQQPGWGQQPPPPPQQQPTYGGYDQTYGYGGQPQGPQGYGYPPQPPKKTGLIVALVAAGVLVVGGGVTAIVLLSGNGSDNGAGGTTTSNSADAGIGTPEDLVNKVIDAVENKDSRAAEALLCDKKSSTPAFELDKAPKDITIKATLAGKVTHSGTSAASARLNLKVTEASSARSTTLPLSLRMSEKAGKWCVENANMGSSSSSSSRPTTRTSY